MSSSGTPFVSGTMSFMPLKKRRTQPGGKAETILGKKVVVSAAKIQCVKLPSDCLPARCSEPVHSEFSFRWLGKHDLAAKAPAPSA